MSSASRSLSDVASLADHVEDQHDDDDDDVSSHGDGTHLSAARSPLGRHRIRLENGDYMDADDLARCLDELDNASPATGSRWQPVQGSPRLTRPQHCRREAVVCVVSLRTASTFCYAVISRLGRVGVYDSSLSLLDSYTLEMGFTHPHAKIGIGREGDLREPRQRTVWVNDAVFLPDAQMLVVASSDRSLAMLDASRLLHCRRCEVRSLPAAARCLAYAPADGDAPSRLFLGDEAGSVTTLAFLQPKRALLRPPDAENKSTFFFWPELRQQTEWVTVQQEHKVHGDAVCRLCYEAHNDTLVSGSRDPQRSLVIRHLGGRREPYVFSLPRGVSCFVLDRMQQLLVTGGRDALVRLWNPLVPSQPQATLHGHKHPVLDVAVLHQLVISMDLCGTLKVWHSSEHTCVQTVALPFTCVRVPGRSIEYGARSLYPGPPRSPGRGRGRGDGAVLVAALCGELVLVKFWPPPPPPPQQPPARDGDGDGTGARESGGGTSSPGSSRTSCGSRSSRTLAPPRREQSPAVPESWSPSLLSPPSSLSSSARGGGGAARRRCSRSLVSPRAAEAEGQDSTPRRRHSAHDEDAAAAGDPAEDSHDEGPGTEAEDADDESDVHSDAVLKSTSPLPESIEDWPLPDDRLFKEDEPPLSPRLLGARLTAPGGGAPPESASHRPVPDENGLYPEEVASLRALGLRPLDLEAIGVSLSATAAGAGAGGALLLLPMDAQTALRQARAQQNKSYKQMRTLAWHCAPHLALKLPDETPLEFSRPLPVSSRMRARGLDVSDPLRLMKAKLGRLGLGAASAPARSKASTGSARIYINTNNEGLR
ncbi:WD repeat-containing protein on Y chromosome [Frankliniella fusca]|uniref:WD repeat-containing protein on Y chromosome n=1 Tax=Frankliniella fusca TaxID=407009 RepID=A0AAE1GXY4_9NEOP|nr:WD repeat-containing protein on Y chromosome [Frankliniella fusca]